MPGRNIIYLALFVQKAGKWLRLFYKQYATQTHTWLSATCTTTLKTTWRYIVKCRKTISKAQAPLLKAL